MRHGRERLDQEIKAIFGDDDKTVDGVEKSVTYSEFLEKILTRTRREFLEHEEMMNKKKIPLGQAAYEWSINI